MKSKCGKICFEDSFVTMCFCVLLSNNTVILPLDLIFVTLSMSLNWPVISRVGYSLTEFWNNVFAAIQKHACNICVVRFEELPFIFIRIDHTYAEISSQGFFFILPVSLSLFDSSYVCCMLYQSTDVSLRSLLLETVCRIYDTDRIACSCTWCFGAVWLYICAYRACLSGPLWAVPSFLYCLPCMHLCFVVTTDDFNLPLICTSLTLL